MAGIGFVLRKLLKKNDLSGITQAYMHAVLASSGPWLFTVIALGGFFLLTRSYADINIINNFRVILLYNFAFSLVITAPITTISTRFLADLIYKENVDDAPGMLLGTLILLAAFGVALGGVFYIYFTTMTLSFAWIAAVDFTLICMIWQASIFISALKQYLGVTISFVIGLVSAVFFSYVYSDYLHGWGMITGFNVGLGMILASLIALIFSEYPEKTQNLFKFLNYFKKYWELALGGLFYSIGIWVDKWIMWFSPEAITLPTGLIMYPHYDSAMFIAYLTVIPAMAVFLINQETSFFEYYVRLFQGIQDHVNFNQIEENRELLIRDYYQHSKAVLLMQGAVAFLTVLAAPKILEFLGMNAIQLGIFRFGVLGAMFQVLTLFTTITIAYFDNRRDVLIVQFVFMVLNTALTLFTLKLGFPFYGVGYFIAALLTFIFSLYVLERCLKNLIFNTFVFNNLSVEK